MENNYEIYMGNDPVGKACLAKEGLYWKISCRCQLPQEGMHRVIIKTGKENVNLGILVPEGDSFCLTTRVAMKRLEEGNPMFLIKPKQQPQMDGGIQEEGSETDEAIPEQHPDADATSPEQQPETGAFVPEQASEMGAFIPEQVSEPDAFIQEQGPEKNLDIPELEPEPICEDSFVPIAEGKPFEYIELLKNSYLEAKDGQVGISLQGPELSKQDSGPSQEFPGE